MMEKKSIILVKISFKETVNFPPLGLLYIGDVLEKAGYKVSILHISPEEDLVKVTEKIIEENPLFLGFSVIIGDPIRTCSKLCKRIKAINKDIPIGWGGVHPSLTARECLKEEYIDIVVMKEGEETVLELARTIESDRDLREVRGIGFKRRGEVVFTSPRPYILNLDAYTIGWELIDIERHLIRPNWENKRKRVLSLVTSRGCPFDCSFCYNPIFNERRLRAHSVEYIIDKVKNLKERYKIDGIFFQDDYFFANKKRAFSILENIDLPYYVEGRVDDVTPEFVQRLNETGCRQFLLGVESGSNRMLKVMNKGFSSEDIKKSFLILKDYPEIMISASMVLGLPTETKEDFIKTVDLIMYLFENHPNVSFTIGWLLPFPGTPMYNLALKNGFIPPQRIDEWEDYNRWTAKAETSWSDWFSSKTAERMRFYTLILWKAYHRPMWRIFRPIMKKRFLMYGYNSKFCIIFVNFVENISERFYLLILLLYHSIKKIRFRKKR